MTAPHGAAGTPSAAFPCCCASLRRSFSRSSTAALVGLGSGSPVELSFDGVGLFRRGWTWLLAGASAELAARQQRVIDAVAAAAAGAELHKHYKPEVGCSIVGSRPRVVGPAADGGRGCVRRVTAQRQAGSRGPSQQRNRRGLHAAHPAVTHVGVPNRTSCVTCRGDSSSRQVTPSSRMVRTSCSVRISMARVTPASPPAINPYT